MYLSTHSNLHFCLETILVPHERPVELEETRRMQPASQMAFFFSPNFIVIKSDVKAFSSKKVLESDTLNQNWRKTQSHLRRKGSTGIKVFSDIQVWKSDFSSVCKRSFSCFSLLKACVKMWKPHCGSLHCSQRLLPGKRPG